MTIFAAILLVFVSIQLGVAISNLFLYNSLRLRKEGSSSGLVSVLIPARNEELNIGYLLSDLLSQNYLDVEVLVYDDLSEDGTANVVREYQKRMPYLKLIGGESLPAGWLGKNHACYRLSMEAKGEFFLFLDADVRIKRSLIRNVINYFSKNRLNLLSIFPVQNMKSTGEWLTVPIMNQILLSLLPLSLVKGSSRTSLSAANGQFMLFDRDSYMSLNPHFRLKSSSVEDIECARLFKKSGKKVSCLPGNKLISCRMYSGFKSSVAGFTKNIIQMFSNSIIFATLYGLLSISGIIASITMFDNDWVKIYIVFQILLISIISITSRQNIVINIFTYIPRQFILGYIIIESLITAKNRILIWKGRNIY